MKHFTFYILFALVFFQGFALAKTNILYVEKFNDYSQADLRQAIEGYTLGGFCVPTSASNIIKEFYRGKDVDQVEIIKTLSSPEYMDTIQGKGTSPSNFLKGVAKYMDENFMGYRYIRYQAPFDIEGNYIKDGFYVDLDWISRGVGLNRGAWLSFWLADYDEETDSYNILRGGHMVTVVGYILNHKVTALVINDGADNSRNSAVHINLEEIQTGNLIFNNGNSYPAEKFWKVSGDENQGEIRRFGKTVMQHEANYAASGDFDTLIIKAGYRIRRR